MAPSGGPPGSAGTSVVMVLPRTGERMTRRELGASREAAQEDQLAGVVDQRHVQRRGGIGVARGEGGHARADDAGGRAVAGAVGRQLGVGELALRRHPGIDPRTGGQRGDHPLDGERLGGRDRRGCGSRSRSAPPSWSPGRWSAEPHRGLLARRALSGGGRRPRTRASGSRSGRARSSMSHATGVPLGRAARTGGRPPPSDTTRSPPGTARRHGPSPSIGTPGKSSRTATSSCAWASEWAGLR